MEAISILAHFDGDRILLDEYFELEPNARLLVTVLPERDDEYLDWMSLSIQNIARAWDLHEPEYSIDSLKEVNPEYERR